MVTPAARTIADWQDLLASGLVVSAASVQREVLHAVVIRSDDGEISHPPKRRAFRLIRGPMPYDPSLHSVLTGLESEASVAVVRYIIRVRRKNQATRPVLVRSADLGLAVSLQRNRAPRACVPLIALMQLSHLAHQP